MPPTKSLDCYDHYQESLCGLLSRFPFFYAFTNQSPYTESRQVPIAEMSFDETSNNMKLVLNPDEFPRYNLKDQMFHLGKQTIHQIRLHPISPFAKHDLWPLAANMDAVSTMLAMQGPDGKPFFTMPEDPDDPGHGVYVTLDGVARQIEAMWAAKGQLKQITAPEPELGALDYFNWLLENVPVEAKEPGKDSQPNPEGKPQKQKNDNPEPDDETEPEQEPEEEDDESDQPDKGEGEDGDGESDDDSQGGGEEDSDDEGDGGEGKDDPKEDPNGEDGDGNEDDPDTDSSGDDGDGEGQDGKSGGAPQNKPGKGGGSPRELMQELLDKCQQDWPDMNPDEKEIMKQVIADQVVQAMAQANPPGSLSGSCAELIESLKDKESWERHLNKFTGMSGGLDGRTTMARRNKYGSFPRYVWRPTKKILIMIDTSGSMDSRWIARAIGACDKIAKHADVDVMWIDCEVHEIISFAEAKRRSKKPREDGRTGYEAKGRGGTSMRAGFRHVRDHKLKYDARLVFSDLELGDAKWGDNFGFPPKTEQAGIRTLWIGVKGDAKSHPVPREAGPAIYIPESDLLAA
jgi:hypothetical protein